MKLDDKTIAITGIGGFIGQRMAERALEKGLDVRGLDLSEDAAAEVRALGADVIVGDVRDPEAVARMLQGADVVFHAAAIVRESGDIDTFRQVNVEGSRLLARSAAEMGVGRLVHLSSVMVYGFDYPPNIIEEGPFRGEGNPYCTTKYESEQAVLDFHGEGDLEVTVIRPGDVYGPGSMPWVVRPLEFMKQGIFMLPDGGHGVLDPTYVDNLIDAVFLTIRKDATNQAFNVTDGMAMETRHFFKYHADMLGKKRILTLPSWLLEPLFAMIELGARAIGMQPPASVAALHFINKPHGYSNQKILDLGHEPRVGLDEGMRRVEAWARKESLV
ncbi:MAG: NAD-dependent epimerase/dehydratase family protein [Myxococcota bacterium]